MVSEGRVDWEKKFKDVSEKHWQASKHIAQLYFWKKCQEVYCSMNTIGKHPDGLC